MRIILLTLFLIPLFSCSLINTNDEEILFNGETLEGWTQRNGSATYTVEDGVIVGTTEPGSPNSFLCTDKAYSDFDLRFEVKVDKELNSGVQIRSQTKDNYRGRVNGPQVEIESTNIPKGGEAGYIYGEACGGWMTPVQNRVRHKHFKDGEYNKYRVLAKGPNIKVWLNGVLVTDLTDEEKFKSHPYGFIGLQVHSIKDGKGPFSVRWKNLRIIDLSR